MDVINTNTFSTGFESSVTLQGARFATHALIASEKLTNFVAVLGEGGAIPDRLDAVENIQSAFQADVNITDMRITVATVKNAAGEEIETDALQFTVRATSRGLTQLRVVREIGIFADYEGLDHLFAYSFLMGEDNNNVLRNPIVAGIIDVVEFTITVGITTQIAGALELRFSSLGWITENRTTYLINNMTWTKDIMRRVNHQSPIDPAYYIYVSPDGNDILCNGTKESPFATLKKAIDVGNLYTRDSYVRIELEAGNYYESGISFQGVNNLSIFGTGVGVTNIYITSSIIGPDNHVAGFTAFQSNCIIMNLSLIADYVLPANGIFVSVVSGMFAAVNASIISNVAQTNADTRAFRCSSNGKAVLLGSLPVHKIEGFHVGIHSFQGGDIISQVTGEVITTAYRADYAKILVDTTDNAPIKAPSPISESRGGKVNISHLQGVGNNITIFVDPNGDDRNWGQNSNNAVRTLAQASYIAHRCEDIGVVTINLAEGEYIIDSQVVFNGISRRLIIRGDGLDNTFIVKNSNPGTLFYFDGCNVQLENFSVRVDFDNHIPLSTLMAFWINYCLFYANINVIGTVAQSSMIGFRASRASNVVLDRCQITNMRDAIWTFGSPQHIGTNLICNNLTGTGNAHIINQAGGVTVFNGTKPQSTGANFVITSGMLADNGVWV